MSNPIITLTTDFGTKDYFVGALKGRIYSELPNAKIVDISHEITPFSINESAYIIKNAYIHFPEGSVHIIAVDSEWSIENKHIVFLFDNHYFICADNGLISLITSHLKAEKVLEITLPKEDTKNHFLANFISVACHITRGGNLDVIGKKLETTKEATEIKPFINPEKNQLIGNVIYVDNFGNVISNINKNTFESIRKGRDFEIKARYYTFTKIYQKYNDIVNFELETGNRNDDGKKLVLFNTDDLLEIAIYRSNLKSVGGASSLLGLHYRDTITIRFF